MYLGTALAGTGEGGLRHADIGAFLPGIGADYSFICLWDVGGYPTHQVKPGGFPPLGCNADHWESTLETSQWNLEVPPYGGGDAWCRVGGTGNIHFIKAEHDGPLHSD